MEVFAATDKYYNSYVLGLREMSNKSAQTVLNTFKEILGDVSYTCKNPLADSTDVGHHMLTNITNTMSRNSTNCWNNIVSPFFLT
jgi:hypothetical protein